MFTEALEYPYSDGDGLRSLAIGSLLLFLGFLLVPLVLTTGYSLRVMRAVVDGEPTPPDWDDWGELLVEGLRAVAVSIVYLLLPGLLVVASVGALVVPVDQPVPQSVTILAALVTVVSLPLLLVGLYVAPAALVNVATARRVGAAFELRRLRPTLTSGRYAVAWLLALAVSFLASLVSGAVAGLAIIGAIVGAVLGFYAMVASSYLYARGYEAASPAERTDAPTEVSS